MVHRAHSTEQTRNAILDAAARIFWQEPSRELTLEATAREANVTVQTVIRHFGSRNGVFDAAVEREVSRVAAERDPAAVATPEEAIHQLVAHYERMGDQIVRLLAEEHRSETVARITTRGREWHRSWCDRTFASTLARLRGEARCRRVAQLVAVCDVYTWKLLRRDAGLDRKSTELATLELLTPLLEVS
jgi:AcrR family transcriptional regulator